MSRADALDIAYAAEQYFTHNAHPNFWTHSRDIVQMTTQSSRVTPIGYPLGYILEVVNVTCACGEKFTSSRLMTVTRAGSNGKDIRYAGKSEPWYNAETKTIYQDVSTPICIVCIDEREPEQIPFVDNARVVSGAKVAPTLEKWLADPSIDRQGNVIVRKAKEDKSAPKFAPKSILDFEV